MPTGSFEKNSLGWQLRQLQQRVGEWWELQTDKFKDSIPDVSVPSWLDSPLLGIIFGGLLVLLLLWVAWQILRLLRPYFYSFRSQLSQPVDRTAQTQVAELSVAGWWLRSQKFQQQGNYRQACLCLYRAMLQQLNDSGIAPHQSSRTDGEYLQLIQQLSQPQPYQNLLVIHQQLCFGNAEASPLLFDECQQAYRQINSQ